MPADFRPAQHSENAAAQSIPAAADKKKQILVVVLSVGLLVAILTQPDKQVAVAEPILEANWASPIEPLRQDTSRQARLPESAKLRAQSLAQVCELSRIPRDAIAKLDLLAPEPALARQTLVNRTQRVQAIYGTSTDRAALIGDSIVRGGQPFPDGGKVMDVTTDGIQVAH